MAKQSRDFQDLPSSEAQQRFDEMRLGYLRNWYSDGDARRRLAGEWGSVEPAGRGANSDGELRVDSLAAAGSDGIAQMEERWDAALGKELLAAARAGTWPDETARDPINDPENFDWEGWENGQIAASERKARGVAAIKTGISWRGLNEDGHLFGYYKDRGFRHVIEIVPPDRAWRNEPPRADRYLPLVDGERAGPSNVLPKNYAGAVELAAARILELSQSQIAQARLQAGKRPLTHVQGPEEGQLLPVEVVKSPNGIGFWLGTRDAGGALYSRESVEFWPSEQEAAAALKAGGWTAFRHLNPPRVELLGGRQAAGRTEQEIPARQRSR